MKIVEVVLKTVKDMVAVLTLVGAVSLIFGALILLYPDLLGVLVGLALIISSVAWFVFAIKLAKYAKLKIEI
ncbi:hypothetical protein GF380_06060 [Candidatus Uhrbacteria bacterium]|nr:hypothetical protein [Candidatus Uhrbacteria bacterium]MBD3284542.1 hypothetical protein [Candidatus Uhrbacteria bacterium]